jgi:hypothetical protein
MVALGAVWAGALGAAWDGALADLEWSGAFVVDRAFERRAFV